MKKRTEQAIQSDINDLCDQAGCTVKQRVAHAWKWEIKRWHSHPLMAFTNWWRPAEFDPVSGAHIGGHPNAHRRWARKDAAGWKHRWYGVSCLDAWNCASSLEEFNAWQEFGSPEKDEPFISITPGYERQLQLWKQLHAEIDKIGKSMPEPKAFDYDPPVKGTRLEY